MLQWNGASAKSYVLHSFVLNTNCACQELLRNKCRELLHAPFEEVISSGKQNVMVEHIIIEHQDIWFEFDLTRILLLVGFVNRFAPARFKANLSLHPVGT